MKVILIGNYPADRQQSMLRFAACLQSELDKRGIATELVAPEAVLARGVGRRSAWAKWLAYVDKFVVFPRRLRKIVREGNRDVLYHVCDHSNAVYVGSLAGRSHLVTCHDLLAVRGALGDAKAYCEARPTGKVLQRWILRSLGKAGAVVCDSQATAKDFGALLPRYAGDLSVVLLGLNTPYRRVDDATAWSRLKEVPLSRGVPFLLTVGSQLPRKNREGCLRIMRQISDRFPGPLVFAGQALDAGQRRLVSELNLQSRVVELGLITDEQLEALYSTAHALLFPSYAEGFGWPVLEAQACGCPVVCSDRTSIPEVAGDAAFVHSTGDEPGFGESLLRLLDPAVRARLVEAGYRNAAKFTTDRMVDAYVDVYERQLRKKI